MANEWNGLESSSGAKQRQLVRLSLDYITLAKNQLASDSGFLLGEGGWSRRVRIGEMQVSSLLIRSCNPMPDPAPQFRSSSASHEDTDSVHTHNRPPTLGPFRNNSRAQPATKRQAEPRQSLATGFSVAHVGDTEKAATRQASQVKVQSSVTR